MTLRFARWFVPLTLWTWGGVFVYFYGSGRLQSFLHPTFRPLVLGTGLGLMAAGLLLAFFDRSMTPVGNRRWTPRYVWMVVGAPIRH